MPFLVKKSLDKSHKVRAEVYKQLRERFTGRFEGIALEYRIELLINGLKDGESEVRDYCVEFLMQTLCAKEGEQPKIVRSDNAAFF